MDVFKSILFIVVFIFLIGLLLFVVVKFAWKQIVDFSAEVFGIGRKVQKISFPTYISEIRKIGRLVTLRAMYQKVYIYNKNKDSVITYEEYKRILASVEDGNIIDKIANFLYGYESAAHLVYVFRAGVDLSEISEENVEIDFETKQATVTVPEAKIFEQYFVEKLEHYTDIYKSLVANLPVEAERKIHEIAEADIDRERERIEAEILPQARERAKIFVEQLLKQLGFETVMVM
ncbi:MAG: DUF4230 domain-containing protein [Fervidobacterium sp.]|uniref:Uncharacterized protein n=1 Tax=Fervidobacterium gondwanense DSM 13020 TaxID=1121883 RepID=A0A1M7TF06_FERGO|nr:DUF4230 domain-containing protein [Fervidobacterium gondwanense]SHN69354.1 Protein of unknown function [Fervidobacterium gondwanense DSM 13020]